MNDHRDLQGALLGLEASRAAAKRNHASVESHQFNLVVYGGTGRSPIHRCVFGYGFTTEPDISSGIALMPGDVVLGAVPTGRAVVTEWERGNGGIYLAAKIMWRIRGHRRQRLRCTVTFTGMGLTLPLGGSAGGTAGQDL